MASKYSVAKRREAKILGIPRDTLVTADNSHTLIMHESTLVDIANAVARLQRRERLSQTDVPHLQSFLQQMPLSSWYGKTYADLCTGLAAAFVNRRKTIPDAATPRETLHEYEKDELLQLTSSESGYKYQIPATTDRRGSALVDAPTKKSGSAPGPASGSQIAVDEDFWSRFEKLTIATNQLRLPIQTVPLDSRNRVMNDSQRVYLWNVHAAGQQGQIGNVQLQDTLQQVVSMTVAPFWIPLATVSAPSYRKIRMFVHEFAQQAQQAIEYLGGSYDEVHKQLFHFEFDIVQVVGNRGLLQPVEPRYTFRHPISSAVDRLSVSFRCPYEEMVLEPDRGMFTMTRGTPTALAGTSPHNLVTGDLVYLYNSNSGNRPLDNLLNSQTGHNVTVTSATDFTIPVDSSVVAGTQNNVAVYFASKRIFFQLQFQSIEQ